MKFRCAHCDQYIEASHVHFATIHEGEILLKFDTVWCFQRYYDHLYLGET